MLTLSNYISFLCSWGKKREAGIEGAEGLLVNYMCLNLPELPGIITVIRSKAATIQDLGHMERHIVLESLYNV